MRKIFISFLLSIIGGLSVNAQVITSLGEQNMQIPPTVKDQEGSQRESLRQPIDVSIDTTTAYYSLVDSAYHYISLEQWQQAEDFLVEALVAEPENPNNSLLLSNLATIQRNSGKIEEAIKNYSLALDITPNAVTLLHNRAALYLEMGEVENAQRDYEKIIMLDARDIDSRYNHGMIAMDQGDVAQAMSDFETVQRIDPSSPLSSQGFATLYKALGNYAKAIEHYTAAINIEASAMLLANRADCYLASGHLNDAESDIRDALNLDDSDGFIYLLRAKLNKMRFQRDDMYRDIQLAVSHGVDAAVAKALLQVE